MIEITVTQKKQVMTYLREHEAMLKRANNHVRGQRVRDLYFGLKDCWGNL